MKVLIKGIYSDWPKHLKCQTCEAILEVEKEDLILDYNDNLFPNRGIICPECSSQIRINKEVRIG